MYKKALITTGALFIVMMTIISVVGCGKRNAQLSYNDIEDGPISTSQNGIDTAKSDQFVSDFNIVSTASDDDYKFEYQIAKSDEIYSLDYDLEQVRFDEWGFSIGIPRELTRDYVKVNSLQEIDLSDVANMENVYTFEKDNITFQSIKASERYLAIFRDDEIVNDELREALQTQNHSVICKYIPDNSIFSLSNASYSSLKQDDKDYGICYRVALTPLSSKELQYNGVAIFFVSNDHLYYVLYGETNLLDFELSKRGYDNAIVETIKIDNPKFVEIEAPLEKYQIKQLNPTLNNNNNINNDNLNEDNKDMSLLSP
jgi:hypothetical protein